MVMNIHHKSEFAKLIGDKEHVIMSDGLDLNLGEPVTIDQMIEVGGSKFVCTTLRAKITNLVHGDDLLWELDVEIPGFSLMDMLDDSSVTFYYADATFVAVREVELKCAQSPAPIMTFTARRIINNNE